MYSILDNIKSNDKNEIIFINDKNQIRTAEQAADEILSWNTADIPNDIFIKIENILQKLQSDNINENLFTNEEVVISALNVKIIERENLLHPKKSNKDAFADIVATNDDVREKMNFIETKSKDNKEVDYISLRNDDNTVDVLVCRTETEIQDYIKKHGDEIPSRSAKEIFYDMNNMFRVPLNFQRLSEYNSDPKLSKHEEKQKVREAVKSFGLEGHIYVAVDCFKERIYKIGDGIFKFDSENDGTIEFLQEPRNMRNLNKQEEKQEKDTFLDEMLNTIQDNIESIEPDDEYKELEQIDAYEKETNQEPEIVPEATEESIPDDKFDEEVVEQPVQEEVEEDTLKDRYIRFDSNKFNHLLKKAYASKLDKNDLHMLSTYIYLLSNERTLENSEDLDQKRLGDYFYFMHEDYDRACNVKEERIPEVMDLELYNALAYLEQKEMNLLPKTKEEYNLDEYVQEEPKQLKRTNGVALIVIIVEIIIVALFLLMLFTLDI